MLASLIKIKIQIFLVFSLIAEPLAIASTKNTVTFTTLDHCQQQFNTEQANLLKHVKKMAILLDTYKLRNEKMTKFYHDKHHILTVESDKMSKEFENLKNINESKDREIDELERKLVKSKNDILEYDLIVSDLRKRVEEQNRVIEEAREDKVKKVATQTVGRDTIPEQVQISNTTEAKTTFRITTWPNTTTIPLRYKLIINKNMPKSLKINNYRKEIRKTLYYATKVWSDASKKRINFKRVPGKGKTAEITIRFSNLTKLEYLCGDTRNAYGCTLIPFDFTEEYDMAEAQNDLLYYKDLKRHYEQGFTDKDRRGNIYLNTEIKNWKSLTDLNTRNSHFVSNNHRKVSLFTVLAHELGHSLGLTHNNFNRSSLMFPENGNEIERNHVLCDYDRKRLEKLYGWG